MPRNGSGTMNRVENYTTDAANNINPAPGRFDADANDIANEITNSIAADGQTQPTNNLPMATHRHTNVGAAVNRTDYLRADQAQDSTIQWGGTAAGTANAITIAPTPAIAAYASGQVFRFIASGTNAAGGTTIAISGLAAKNITQKGTLALGGGELKSGYIIEVTYDGTEFQLTGVFDPSIRTDVASAATLNLDTVPSNYANVTGTTTVTAITLSNGVRKDVLFAGVLTLTNGASLILPGAANITTAAGDTAVFVGEASGVVRCISYTQGASIAGNSGRLLSTQYITSSQTVNAVPGAANYDIVAVGGGGGGGGSSSTAHAGAGGGPGGYSRKFVSAASFGASQSVTIGAAGSAGTTGNGGSGGTTSVGALLSVTGGGPGLGQLSNASASANSGGAPGVGSSGDENTSFSYGGEISTVASGEGGPHPLGVAGKRKTTSSAGDTGTGYGAGGSGAWNIAGGTIGGGAGAPGVVVIRAYS